MRKSATGASRDKLLSASKSQSPHKRTATTAAVGSVADEVLVDLSTTQSFKPGFTYSIYPEWSDAELALALKPSSASAQTSNLLANISTPSINASTTGNSNGNGNITAAINAANIPSSFINTPLGVSVSTMALATSANLSSLSSAAAAATAASLQATRERDELLAILPRALAVRMDSIKRISDLYPTGSQPIMIVDPINGVLDHSQSQDVSSSMINSASASADLRDAKSSTSSNRLNTSDANMFHSLSTHNDALLSICNLQVGFAATYCHMVALAKQCHTSKSVPVAAIPTADLYFRQLVPPDTLCNPFVSLTSKPHSINAPSATALPTLEESDTEPISTLTSTTTSPFQLYDDPGLLIPSSSMCMVVPTSYPWDRIFPKGPNGLPTITASGRYAVKLFWCGSWRCIPVDDRIPLDMNGRPLLLSSSLPTEIWPLLLTKALLKLACMSYCDIELDSDECEWGGFSAIHALTGWLPEIVATPRVQLLLSSTPLSQSTRLKSGSTQKDDLPTKDNNNNKDDRNKLNTESSDSRNTKLLNDNSIKSAKAKCASAEHSVWEFLCQNIPYTICSPIAFFVHRRCASFNQTSALDISRVNTAGPQSRKRSTEFTRASAQSAPLSTTALTANSKSSSNSTTINITDSAQQSLTLSDTTRRVMAANISVNAMKSGANKLQVMQDSSSKGNNNSNSNNHNNNNNNSNKLSAYAPQPPTLSPEEQHSVYPTTTILPKSSTAVMLLALLSGGIVQTERFRQENLVRVLGLCDIVRPTTIKVHQVCAVRDINVLNSRPTLANNKLSVDVNNITSTSAASSRTPESVLLRQPSSSVNTAIGANKQTLFPINNEAHLGRLYALSKAAPSGVLPDIWIPFDAFFADLISLQLFHQLSLFKHKATLMHFPNVNSVNLNASPLVGHVIPGSFIPPVFPTGSLGHPSTGMSTGTGSTGTTVSGTGVLNSTVPTSGNNNVPVVTTMVSSVSTTANSGVTNVLSNPADVMTRSFSVLYIPTQFTASTEAVTKRPTSANIPSSTGDATPLRLGVPTSQIRRNSVAVVHSNTPVPSEVEFYITFSTCGRPSSASFPYTAPSLVLEEYNWKTSPLTADQPILRISCNGTKTVLLKMKTASRSALRFIIDTPICYHVLVTSQYAIAIDEDINYLSERWPSAICIRDIEEMYPAMPANAWNIILKQVFDVPIPTFFTTQLFLPEYLNSFTKLHVYNNDTGKELPNVVNLVLPQLFQPNKRGYTIVAESKYPHGARVPGKYKLRFVSEASTDLSTPLSIPVPTPSPLIPTLVLSVAQPEKLVDLGAKLWIQDFEDVYTPNRTLLLFRNAIRISAVPEAHMGFHISFGTPTVVVVLQIFEDDVEIFHSKSRGAASIPEVLLFQTDDVSLFTPVAGIENPKPEKEREKEKGAGGGPSSKAAKEAEKAAVAAAIAAAAAAAEKERMLVINTPLSSLPQPKRKYVVQASIEVDENFTASLIDGTGNTGNTDRSANTTGSIASSSGSTGLGSTGRPRTGTISGAGGGSATTTSATSAQKSTSGKKKKGDAVLPSTISTTNTSSGGGLPSSIVTSTVASNSPGIGGGTNAGINTTGTINTPGPTSPQSALGGPQGAPTSSNGSNGLVTNQTVTGAGNAPVFDCAWRLRIVSSETQGIHMFKDTEKEDRYRSIKEGWETAQPGRSTKAREVREQYLISLKQQTALAASTTNFAPGSALAPTIVRETPVIHQPTHSGTGEPTPPASAGANTIGTLSGSGMYTGTISPMYVPALTKANFKAAKVAMSDNGEPLPHVQTAADYEQQLQEDGQRIQHFETYYESIIRKRRSDDRQTRGQIKQTQQERFDERQRELQSWREYDVMRRGDYRGHVIREMEEVTARQQAEIAAAEQALAEAERTEEAATAARDKPRKKK